MLLVQEKRQISQDFVPQKKMVGVGVGRYSITAYICAGQEIDIDHATE